MVEVTELNEHCGFEAVPLNAGSLVTEQTYRGDVRKRGILCDHQAGENLLKRSMEKLNLSACAYDRILKVRRTVADLAGSDDIKVEHLAEAIHYRSLDREGWAG